jgi:citrate lyase beta subunit
MKLNLKIFSESDYRIIPWMYSPAIYLTNAQNTIKTLLTENPDLHLIFDLEDALQNVEDREKEKQVKHTARLILEEKIKDYQEFSDRLYLRTNAFHTPHLKADLNLLAKIKYQIRGVILSKCEKTEEIKTIQRFNLEAVPMIETQKGFKNILPLVRNANRYFRLGINDYLYGKKIFPMPLSPLEDKTFDELIKHMFQIAKTLKKTYSVPIYTRLKDQTHFTEIMHYYLQFIEKGQAIGMTALTPKQLAVLSNLRNTQWSEIKPHYRSPSLKEKFTFAWHMVKTYENRKNKDLGVTKMKHRSDGQYVTYHYYQPCRDFLKTLLQEQPQIYETLKQEIEEEKDKDKETAKDPT